jgi:immune inhibitor A
MAHRLARPPVRRHAPTLAAAATAAVVIAFATLSLQRLTSAAPIGNPEAVGLHSSAAPARPAAAPLAPALQRVGPSLGHEVAAAKGDDFISYVEPGDFLVYQSARERAGPNASAAEVEQAAEAFRLDWAADVYHGPEPAKAQALLAREQAWLDATSPDPAADGADAAARPDVPLAPAVTGTLRLFAVAVEFDGTETAENFPHETGIRTGACVTETVTYDGPLHNEIAHPGPRDNATTWLPRFERDFYEKMVFSEEGVTERLRPDLVDPEDGLPGIDIGGHSMSTYFREISGGRVTFDGGPKGVIAWVKVPHSVGYYSANPCRPNQQGVMSPSGSGLPTNPRFPNGMSSLIADIATAINAADPDFPWVDYDTDGDRELDHVLIFHAGIDESEGGGVDGNQQIWAHRGSVNAATGTVDDRGTPDIATDDIMIRGYTIQPENSSLGVLVHEFGHDLGLPDLYTTTGDDDVTWWDLMSVGARTGRLNGADPTHMSVWCKTALGWGEPVVVRPGEDPEDYLVGQAAIPPAGSLPALRVDLPPALDPIITLPAGSKRAWWGGDGQTWADHRLERNLDLSSATGSVSLTFQLDHVLQNNRDFFFVEVSIDGGQTYTQTKGYRVGTNAELTTPDNYADPQGRLALYGGLKHGYTNTSNGWRSVTHDLSAFAGRSIKLRLRYASDDSGQSRGVFADNFRVLAGGRVIWSDPVEGEDPRGWTSTPGTFQGAPLVDEGWRISDGTKPFARYYLLEWRNPVNYDLGLKYTYNTVFAELTAAGERELLVDWVPSNVPGLVVWLRDTRFGLNSPSNGILGTRNMTSLPSEGAKGGLLVIDANPDPLRAPRGSRFTNAFGRFPFPPDDNWRGRVQTTNNAFSLAPTAPVTLTFATGTGSPATTVMTATRYPALPAVPGFHDALGYGPGVELLPVPITIESSATTQRIKRYAFSDPDAGVVVPAAGYYPPRTPAGFTGLGGETSPPSADVSSDETMFLRGTAPAYVNVGGSAGINVTGANSGNPGDSGVHFGFHFKVMDQAADGSTGTIRVWRQADAAEVSGSLSSQFGWGPLRVEEGVRNVGGAYTLTLYSDFDEAAAGLVAGSMSSGAVPVAVPPEAVVRAVVAGGLAGLKSLEVPPEQAIAVAWTAWVSSGTHTGLIYLLAPHRPAGTIRVTNSVYKAVLPVRLLDSMAVRDTFGSWAYLPVARYGE